MKRALYCLCAVTVVSVVGCGTNDKEAERITNDLIAQANELVSALESVQDKATAQAAAARIDAVCDKLQKLADEAKDVRVTQSKSDELEAKIQAEMGTLETRVTAAAMSAGMKCEQDEAFIASLQRLEKVAMNIQFEN